MFLSPGSRVGGGKKGTRFKTTGLIAILQYTSTQTVVVPLGATKAFVRLWGGSGGGGTGGACATAGGGSGAGYLEKFLSGLIQGQTLALTVGAAAAAGGNGGNSILASGTATIATLTANGGIGGGGSGGTATGGDLNIVGQIGSVPGGGMTGGGRSAGGKGGTSGAGAVGIIGGATIEWYA